MPRVTALEVKGVLLSDYGPLPNGGGYPDLAPFIEIANSVATDLKAAILLYRKKTAPEATITIIEKWLSAHFYVMSDQNYTSKSQGGVSASFQGQTAMGLRASKYGMAAITADTTRTLAAIEDGKIASAAWTGRRPSEQTDYIDRD